MQLGSHLALGKTARLVPSDEDRFDPQQGFADYALDLAGAGRLTLRGGRQEMAFGSSRLVSVREGPNVLRSFDGGRASLDLGDGTRLDAFLTRPVLTARGAFDDRANPGQAFWGVYGTTSIPGLPGFGVDAYYLGFDRARAEFNQGTERETRHTAGVRLFGSAGALDYNFEAAYQWGRFGDALISAWTLASDTGWTARGMPFTPRFGLKADIASGDRNPADRRLGTFNPLFPRGSYFSEAGVNGPANVIDVNLSLGLTLAEGVRATMGADLLWRASSRDAFYTQSLAPLIPGNAGHSRFVGVQAQALLEWQVSRHAAVSLAYVRFQRGAFVREAGGRSIDFASAVTSFKF